ncbi:hypothetical protein [Dietzia cinnamea]|uniref:hypothetical protein n=1 Tax=Dietzia cinnamea TaxID=321318 RepID=UPI0007742856|nr:hypothetical protein [Dietzia cinnamea]
MGDVHRTISLLFFHFFDSLTPCALVEHSLNFGSTARPAQMWLNRITDLIAYVTSSVGRVSPVYLRQYGRCFHDDTEAVLPALPFGKDFQELPVLPHRRS